MSIFQTFIKVAVTIPLNKIAIPKNENSTAHRRLFKYFYENNTRSISRKHFPKFFFQNFLQSKNIVNRKIISKVFHGFFLPSIFIFIFRMLIKKTGIFLRI